MKYIKEYNNYEQNLLDQGRVYYFIANILKDLKAIELPGIVYFVHKETNAIFMLFKEKGGELSVSNKDIFSKVVNKFNYDSTDDYEQICEKIKYTVEKMFNIKVYKTFNWVNANTIYHTNEDNSYEQKLLDQGKEYYFIANYLKGLTRVEKNPPYDYFINENRTTILLYDKKAKILSTSLEFFLEVKRMFKYEEQNKFLKKLKTVAEIVLNLEIKYVVDFEGNRIPVARLNEDNNYEQNLLDQGKIYYIIANILKDLKMQKRPGGVYFIHKKTNEPYMGFRKKDGALWISFDDIILKVANKIEYNLDVHGDYQKIYDKTIYTVEKMFNIKVSKALRKEFLNI